MRRNWEFAIKTWLLIVGSFYRHITRITTNFKTNSRTANKKICPILWNPKFQYLSWDKWIHWTSLHLTSVRYGTFLLDFYAFLIASNIIVIITLSSVTSCDDFMPPLQEIFVDLFLLGCCLHSSYTLSPVNWVMLYKFVEFEVTSSSTVFWVVTLPTLSSLSNGKLIKQRVSRPLLACWIWWRYVTPKRQWNVTGLYNVVS
jgi:hypothetical protein